MTHISNPPGSLRHCHAPFPSTSSHLNSSKPLLKHSDLTLTGDRLPHLADETDAILQRFGVARRQRLLPLESSSFGDKFFRLGYRTGAEIVVPGACNAHEALGRSD